MFTLLNFPELITWKYCNSYFFFEVLTCTSFEFSIIYKAKKFQVTDSKNGVIIRLYDSVFLTQDFHVSTIYLKFWFLSKLLTVNCLYESLTSTNEILMAFGVELSVNKYREKLKKWLLNEKTMSFLSKKTEVSFIWKFCKELKCCATLMQIYRHISF